VSKHRIILDTDIGSDVDDAMALAFLVGRTDVQIVGVTTVYGNTDLRARIAARYAKLMGVELSIYAGRSEPLSGRETWKSGNEGSLLPGLEGEVYESLDAVDFLTAAVSNEPGKVEVVAIGPLTNIALAIEADPNFAKNVKHLWIMGGEFVKGTAEHNFRSDDVSTKIVIDSGIHMTITGLEITQQLQIMRNDLEIIATAGSMGTLLFAEIDQWLTYRKEDFDVPHDPIAIMPMLEPQLFIFSKEGIVEIEISDSDMTGKSRFSEQSSGNIRIVQGFKKVEVQREILDSILRAG
jgi:purine nucleosidase